MIQILKWNLLLQPQKIIQNSPAAIFVLEAAGRLNACSQLNSSLNGEKKFKSSKNRYTITSIGLF